MEGAVNHERLSFNAHLQVSLLNIDGELLGRGTLGDVNVDSNFVESLFPRVFVSRPAISCIRERPLGLLLLILFVLIFFLGKGSSVSLC